MAIKLIAIDLDDTLLDENRKITPAVKSAIQTASDAGIVVVLASGRMYPSILPIYEELALRTPVMCCNGAYVIMPDGSTLYRQPIKRAVTLDVLNFARNNGLYVQYYVGQDYFFEREGEESALYAKLSGVTGKYMADMGQHEMEPDKLLFIGLPDLYGRLDEIKNRFPMLAVTMSKPFYIEVNDPEANKGLATHKLAEHYGFAKDQIMCIGDNLNDLPMLTTAGLAVAMGNAPDSVKSVCHKVTLPNTESGVAHAIYTWALPT